MGKWISLNGFMKRYQVGYEVALEILDSGKFVYQKTDGGRYKILVDNDVVPKEQYENLLAEKVKLETQLANIKAILV